MEQLKNPIDRASQARSEAEEFAEERWKDAEFKFFGGTPSEAAYVRALVAELRAARLDRQYERLAAGAPRLGG